ncbi:PhoX family protein [Chitinilyticum aquatile]|uniref:PhoX family protein n=1 Tax=Chitinilyticum aquatile TaxID=362520 RepID=UPI0004215E54|nr:PhoX family phosphatase [Chitinilyticum aquatile]
MTKSYSDKNVICNDSTNPAFSQIASAINLNLSRRSLLTGSGAAATGLLLAGLPDLASAAAQSAARAGKALKPAALGFAGIPLSDADTVTVPAGYRAQLVNAWGDAVGLAGNLPAFKQDGSNSFVEQMAQSGMHHDGMHFFPLPYGSQNSAHGLLAINHEYTDDGLLHTDGMKTWTAEKVRKAQAAHGVSIIEVKKGEAGWQQVLPSSYARRVSTLTACAISGPAAGHALMKTVDDPTGREVLGTLNNCANGWTPWGTYLTCEENWNGYFVDWSNNMKPDGFNAKRYGVKEKDAGYRWAEHDLRFDAQLNPHEPNRFGWVVEIDPYHPDSKPVKRTALGRFKHEGAALAIAPDQRCVFYMGDDERFEYIYKFVTKRPYDAKNRRANANLLDEGTLYVAKFNADGSGEWLELTHGKNGLTAANGFADQGELLVKTRLAADHVGATKMDRPEWTTVNPHNQGEIFCTLTNNSERGKEGKPGPDAANPRANNLFGHIMRWVEAGNNPAATTFQWNILVLAGNDKAAKDEHKGNIKGDVFGSPDGLHFDANGLLWVQTDVSTTTLNKKEYAGMGNNQMVAMVPETGEARRFLTGPRGCEITGIAFTPDHKTLFVNIQHPGEPDSERNDPANPKAISSWPNGALGGRPRSGTVVITRDDGGVIGL